MVYQPLEDSFLMQECVKRFAKDKIVLDMGTGTGIQALTAYQSGAEKVIASDVNDEAVEEAVKTFKARDVNIKVRKSNLFNNFKPDEVFDLIIFNPPYLPDDDNLPDDSDLTGGEVGNELTIKFLKQAKKHLQPNGLILLICSSLSNPMETFAYAKAMGYKYEILEERRLNMETLYCVKLIID